MDQVLSELTLGERQEKPTESPHRPNIPATSEAVIGLPARKYSIVTAASLLVAVLPISLRHVSASPSGDRGVRSWHVTWSRACAEGTCVFKFFWDCVTPNNPFPQPNSCDYRDPGCLP